MLAGSLRALYAASNGLCVGRQRGASLTEYVLLLSMGMMLSTTAYHQYGNQVRQHMAKMSDKFAEYYYQGWFWPEDDLASAGSSGTAGHGHSDGGSPSEGGPSAPGGADGSGLPASGDGSSNNGNGNTGGSDNGNSSNSGGGNTAGGNGNNFSNSGGAGSSSPLQCTGSGSGSANGDPFGSSAGNTLASNASSFTDVGNPIDLGTGNKFQTEMDYAGPGALHFTRYYNSVLADRDGGVGHGWRHSYQRNIVVDQEKKTATVWRDDGTQYPFALHDQHTAAPLGVIDQLERTDSGWLYHTGNGDLEHYDSAGRLQRIDTVNGRSHSFVYNTAGELIQIADDRGARLTLHWQSHHLQHIELPTQGRVDYTYDATYNLQHIQRSHSLVTRLTAAFKVPERVYHYDDARHPHALTGLDDATDARYATWGYDNMGRANLSQHGAGAEKITLDYRTPDAAAIERTVVVTNTAGLAAIYTLEPARPGKYRLKDIDGHPMLNCSAVQNHHRYDSNGFVRYQFNADRIGSRYTRNNRGLIEIEEHGLRFDQHETPYTVVGAARIERQWDKDRPWALTETRTSWQSDRTHPQGYWQPVIQRSYTYDDRGRVLSDTLADLTEQAIPYVAKGQQRTRAYTYEFADAQRTQIRTMAVTDNQNATTYHYQNDQLQRITNALNQTTEFQHYKANGQAEDIRLPNGQTVHISYNDQGLPTRIERAAQDQDEKEIATADYDAAGKLIRLTRPDGSAQHYAYNSAGQLRQIKNNRGETLELTPNALTGQWEEQTLLDENGDPVQRQHRRFNALGQLAAVLGNAGQQTAFTYNASGDLIAASEGDEDPASADRNHTTQAQHDTQHRLLALIDAAGYRTQYIHSVSGAIEAVTDANHNTTEFLRNGFGDVIQQTSPTIGRVIKRYDVNGNLIANESPAGDKIKFDYDSLNRITKVDYPGEQNDIAYTYDQTDSEHGNGVQQLTQIDTQTQRIDYCYDGLGRKTQETSTDKDNAGKPTSTTTVKYAYRPGNRLSQITYPDGSLVEYHYDRERIERVTYTDAHTYDEKTIVHDIAYAPFGGPIGWTYGNGLTQTQQHDQDGRLTAIELVRNGFNDNQIIWSQAYQYDLYQNITQIQRADGDQKLDQQFVYDHLDRLTQETVREDKKQYDYDALGNRDIAAESAPAIDYDTAGNVTREQTQTHARAYRYNGHNRPALVSDNHEVKALYRYNPLGWRAEKRTYQKGDIQRTHYTYSSAGKLLSEQQRSGGTTTHINYVWLGPLPLAQIESSTDTATAQIIYLHTDHLTALRLATNDQQKIIWRWHSDAFGNGAPDENPDHDQHLTHINLRFAGQYADAETGLYYNLNRYYDPERGRYTQSDPLGQLASMNTYSYVDANPVSWLDPLGLAKLQYVLIDSFGGDPANSSKSTLKAGTDKRMVHFAFLLTDIVGANGASLIYDPNGIEPQTKDKGYYAWNNLEAAQSGLYDGDYIDKRPWSSFRDFYERGYGGKNAFNTGDLAVINDYDDNQAAELYRGITGNYPAGYASSGNASCPAPRDYLLPNLPQGFYAMEHFNFPTIVHKLPKPIFDVADLPAVDDAAFHTFPWHNDLTKVAEASDSEAIHPHHPAPGSGITLGRGFDLSKFSGNKTLIQTALQRVGIDKKLITDAVGLSTKPKKNAAGKDIPGTDDASVYWDAHKGALRATTITAEQQYLLSLYAFEAKETNVHDVGTPAVIDLYDRFIKGATGTAWEDLDSKIQDVLFDLNYRGDFHDLSANTVEKTRTPFDDVQFAKDFREAASSNKVGDLCRVMEKGNWLDDPNYQGNPWKVPRDRFEKRRDSLRAGSGVCPP